MPSETVNDDSKPIAQMTGDEAKEYAREEYGIDPDNYCSLLNKMGRGDPTTWEVTNIVHNGRVPVIYLRGITNNQTKPLARIIKGIENGDWEVKN